MLAVNYSEVATRGAAAAAPVAVPGIMAGDTLLAVVQWAAGTDPAGLDLTDFAVGNDTITGATIDTTGKKLWVMWCTPRAS